MPRTAEAQDPRGGLALHSWPVWTLMGLLDGVASTWGPFPRARPLGDGCRPCLASCSSRPRTSSHHCGSRSSVGSEFALGPQQLNPLLVLLELLAQLR